MGTFRPQREPDWLSFEEALDRILDGAAPLPPETVPAPETPGRVLARSLVAPLTLPPWDNSAMDGVAVRSDDVRGAGPGAPRTLRVVGRSLPGRPWGGRVEPGQAVLIMTGGPLPEGTDGVIRVEDTRREDDFEITILDDRDLGGHIRPRGQDMVRGEAVLSAGSLLTAGSLALLRGMGVDTVPVVRRPRVALLVTGDELLGEGDPGEPWEDGIPDANTPALMAALGDLGVEVRAVPRGRDDLVALGRAVEQALDTDPDVLVTTGGASMGEADLVKPALEARGFERAFWRVRIRPGSPFSFGRLPSRSAGRSVAAFGLPGNPVSAFVTFQILVRPYLLALSGQKHPFPPVVRAVALEPLRAARDLAVFLRVRFVEGRAEDPSPRFGPASSPHYGVRLAGPQSSGLLGTLGRGEGLAVVPEGVEEIPAGQAVNVVLLDAGLRGMPRVPLGS